MKRIRLFKIWPKNETKNNIKGTHSYDGRRCLPWNNAYTNIVFCISDFTKYEPNFFFWKCNILELSRSEKRWLNKLNTFVWIEEMELNKNKRNATKISKISNKFSALYIPSQFFFVLGFYFFLSSDISRCFKSSKISKSEKFPIRNSPPLETAFKTFLPLEHFLLGCDKNVRDICVRSHPYHNRNQQYCYMVVGTKYSRIKQRDGIY